MTGVRSQQFTIESTTWRWQAVAWAATFDFMALLNNNGIAYPHDPFPNRLFVGTKRTISFTGDDDLQTLYEAHHQRPSWLIGYVTYDVKNQLEMLQSRHQEQVGFATIFFAEPEYVLDFEADTVVIRGDAPETVFHLINTFADQPVVPSAEARSASIEARVSPTEYQAAVRQIQQHILQGDVYELNYCIEFFAESLNLSPIDAYRALMERSPMPFSVFLKQANRYLLCASPERFLKKTGQTLISQPIKGTIRRGKTVYEDDRLKQELRNSEKEQAENLMIVDLVRNDLARSAETGSVKVDELFGVYTFRQVHQMISTVSATLRAELSFIDALRNAFPMGSMTGAPKIRAMQLIDELESSRRGLYSGAAGFITPDGDFDFNVVIRSILYDATTQYASFSVGSAITYDADPAQEYAECLLKAEAMRAVLTMGL